MNELETEVLKWKRLFRKAEAVGHPFLFDDALRFRKSIETKFGVDVTEILKVSERVGK